MKVSILISAIACTMAVACGPSKKSQSSATDSSSSTSSKKLADYQMLDEKTFQLVGVSGDDTYGYSSKNPIKVGSASGSMSGPVNERRFLNGLLGPNGETVTYTRRGSCCQTPSKNGFMGYAMLDIYVIKYDGLSTPIELYINMYDPGELVAPKGFTYKK